MAEASENWWVFPGFRVELFATGLDLPVNLAFVPDPPDDPKRPLLYVTELYGQVRAITGDGTVHTYAQGLLNFEPDRKIPGTGESGLTGICVEPETGDLFLSMIYADGEDIKSRVVRASSGDGLSIETMTTVIDGIPATKAAHQVQAVTIGPDGKLYVNVADGGAWQQAQVDDDLRGKVLRLGLDGSVPDDNPRPGSLVYAKGFRNPFGATWRTSDQSLYVSVNGPEKDDVIARVLPGSDHGWYGDMRKNAMFWWHFTHSPTAIAFMQGDQFPADFRDELFVALFGRAYKRGRAVKGKRIVKMHLTADSTAVNSCEDFVVYTGEGAASPCGLAFGPDGLYFSDLHGEATEGGRPQAGGGPAGNILRVSPA